VIWEREKAFFLDKYVKNDLLKFGNNKEKHMKIVRSLWLAVLIILIPILTFAAEGDQFVLLASTIGPIDAGIVTVLEDSFEKETGIRVRHVGAGTGAALKIAEKGTVDLVMVHAKSLEEKFVQNGFGTKRIPLMYNDWLFSQPSG
jgi:tungstate transport system substrate-binding protein